MCHWMSLGVTVPYRCWCCWHGGGGQSATVAGLQVRAVMDAGYDPIMLLLLLVLACLLRPRQVKPGCSRSDLAVMDKVQAAVRCHHHHLLAGWSVDVPGWCLECGSFYHRPAALCTSLQQTLAEHASCPCLSTLPVPRVLCVDQGAVRTGHWICHACSPRIHC
jgi:hypothetical protein